jgi:DNA-binding MarR family transcriptional regulator
VAARSSRPDPVDALLDQWRRERPDLDLVPMGVFGRLGRLSALTTRAIEAELGRHDLTIADFDVLSSLRRAGEPYELMPSAVARQVMLSPAGMTGRLDRLEAAGLVERRMDPDDRRSFLVRLSPEGLARIDRAVADHVATEAALLGGLTNAQVATLDDLLRRLLTSLDPSD